MSMDWPPCWADAILGALYGGLEDVVEEYRRNNCKVREDSWPSREILVLRLRKADRGEGVHFTSSSNRLLTEGLPWEVARTERLE